jgi:Ca2+-binding EF-hand superfamily protein
MKLLPRSSVFVAAVLGLTVLQSATSFAQQRDPAQRPPENGPGRGGDGPQFFQVRPPAAALRDALDKDKDGKVSADELKAATDSLKSLDKNNDGKLDAEEIGWPPQFGFQGRGGRGGGPGGRGGGPGRGFGRGGFGGQGGNTSPAEFAKRIMSRDANGDGRITPDELTRSMRRVIEIADTNKDGAIDEDEAKRFADQYAAIGRSPVRASAPSPNSARNPN